MKNTNKIIAAASALFLCAALCAFSAFAVDFDIEPYDVDASEPTVGTEAPVANTEAQISEATTEATYYSEESAETTAYYTEEPTATDYYYYEETTVEETTSQGYYSNSYDTSSYYGDSSYLGGGQSMYTVPVETAAEASLYDTDGEYVEDDELSASDWEEIAENLKNASNEDSGGGDFGFIKNNTSDGDNGYWMLVVGIICLLLSAAGITYTILSSAISKKRFRRFYAGAAAPANSGSMSRASTAKAKRRPSGTGQKKRIGSKYDTADVYLPKKSGSSKNSRYKYK